MDFIIGADYNVASSNCPVPPARLAAGNSCALMVEFKPTVVGTPNGTLNESLSVHSFAVHRGETGFNNVNLIGRSQ